jgi:tetratricopeptide (TPR) repeat protein
MTNAPSPEDARAIAKEAFGLFAKGSLDEAVARYREAIAADATLPIAWNGLSMTLAKRAGQGDLEEAIECAEKLVELEPDDPLSHTNLSRILMQKGLIPEAEDARARAMQAQMKQEGGG